MIYRTLIGFCIFTTVLVSSLEAVALEKFTVQDAARRQAVCNDGSPAIYYFRKGYGEAANNWVIFLVGGGFCYSVGSCNARSESSPELTSSNGYPSTLTADGILSDSASQNPDFYNANHVAIPYCSSDLWSGNREGSSGTGGHEFRGKRIFRAIVADLKKHAGNSLSSAKRVLLSGTSAGGIGVMIHLDWLARQFPSADVRGVNDAGWTPDVLSFLDDRIFAQINEAYALWNGQVDSSCARANSNTKFRCYTSAVFPYLSTPMFVQMSQYDTVFLSGLGVTAPFSASEAFLADLFASAVRDSLKNVPAAFSPRTHTHGLLPYDKFTNVTVQDHSLQELLGNWFFGRAGPVKVIR